MGAASLAPVPAALVRRPRVTSTVERPRLEATTAPGLLLVGPAGSGKTVLAAQIAAKAARSGWLRVTAGRAGATDLANLAGSCLSASPPPPNAGLVELAGYLAELLDEPTVLVVDDYAEAIGGECDPLLAEALPILSPGSQIVVCSRARPPGLVGRVAEGVVRCIEAAELAFDHAEARELFERAGSDPGGADRACDEVSGWAAGVAVAATTGYPARPQALSDLVAAALGDSALVEAMAVLPYLTAELAQGLGVGDGAALADLGRRSMLVVEQGAEWRLTPAAAEAIAAKVASATRQEWLSRAAQLLSAPDPATAVELFVDSGAFFEAVSLARRRLSDIPAERAVRWLYRIPDEVRHELPPILAGGRATVDLDAATAAAEDAVHRARDDPSRREAMFGLGSAHLHAGRLSEAAAALEVASGPGSPAGLASAAAGWLAAARWWAGDLVGAIAAAELGNGGPVATWVEAEVRLARGEPAVPEHPCLGGDAFAAKALLAKALLAKALLAKAPLATGDVDDGRRLADRAYQEAVAEGGFALAVAAPVQAWYLVLDGDLDAALAVGDLLNRRMGRHDAFASLHVWLVRLAVAAARRDRVMTEEATGRVARLRQLGFAPIEAQARAMLAPLAASIAMGLEVSVLGTLQLSVDGTEVGTSWRSIKALEVLAYLALRGRRGAQREEIIEAVWPEREPDKGRTLLRAALSEIRRRLEPGRPAGEPSRFLATSGDRIRLDATVDAAAVRDAAGPGRAPEALAMFRGELLEDMPYVEWAFEERRVLSTMRARLADETAGDGDAPTPARVAALEFLIAEEPWRGELYDRLVLLHTAAGNAAASLTVKKRKSEAGAG
jgi:DNA-binding SARP family transcriptional activator